MVMTTKDEIMHVMRRLPTDDVLRIVNMASGLVNSRLYMDTPRQLARAFYPDRESMAQVFEQCAAYIRSNGEHP